MRAKLDLYRLQWLVGDLDPRRKYIQMHIEAIERILRESEPRLNTESVVTCLECGATSPLVVSPPALDHAKDCPGWARYMAISDAIVEGFRK